MLSTRSPAGHRDSIPALKKFVLPRCMRQAPLEFARVVYGLNDRASGRAGTMAAEDVARTVARAPR